MNATPMAAAAHRSSGSDRLVIGLLFVLCAPLGVYRLWRRRSGYRALVPYALLSLPLFAVVYAFVGIIVFAAFLPELDLSVSPTAPRTVRFAEGHYESTFLETGPDTHGTHELIRVQIEPKGGNSAHYHRQFEETFTLLEGQLTVELPGRSVVLRPGESVTAQRGDLHWFHNPGTTATTMTVRVTPARGLEKSIRAAYGIDGAGMWDKGGGLQKMWRMALLLGYSETFLPNAPAPIQEPLVNALAKIAQWLGKDEELQVFFR
jgi:quercetin dioxygenase-like cupin family protein